VHQVGKCQEIIINYIVIIKYLYKDLNIYLIMYCKNFITTYKILENEELSLSLYQSQLLQAFNLSLFDEKLIASNINNIEEELIENLFIKQLKEKLIQKYKNPLLTKENIFTLFFSYDYFNEFHKCYIKNDFSNFTI